MRAGILWLAVTFIAACNTPVKQESDQKPSLLSGIERKYCDSLKIDTNIIIQLRQSTSAAVEPFHYSLSKSYHEDGTAEELDPIYLPGLVFKEPMENTDRVREKLYRSLRDKGYSIFTLENNFGIQGEKDVMAILKTTDKYEILRQVKTDGINYDIDTDSLVKIIRIFDDKYSLDLIGASGEWCEFMITKEPADWMTLAQEAYEVCPDIVDQGTGTVEALAIELKQNKRLYFWWD